jgi:hypothetical protein
LLVNFDPTFVNPTNHRRGRFIVPTSAVIPLIDPAMVAYGVATADEVGVSRGLINSDRNNFAPRLGIAWRLNELTVLREDTASSIQPQPLKVYATPLARPPFNQGRRRRTRNGLTLGGWPGGSTPPGQVPISGGSLDAASTVPSTNLIPFDLQQPRIQQYNATFERELAGRLAFVFPILAAVFPA